MAKQLFKFIALSLLAAFVALPLFACSSSGFSASNSASNTSYSVSLGESLTFGSPSTLLAAGDKPASVRFNLPLDWKTYSSENSDGVFSYISNDGRWFSGMILKQQFEMDGHWKDVVTKLDPVGAKTLTVDGSYDAVYHWTEAQNGFLCYVELSTYSYVGITVSDEDLLLQILYSMKVLNA